MPEIIPADASHFPVIQEIATITWMPTYGHILTDAQTEYMLGWMYGIPSLHEQVTEKGHRFVMLREDDGTFVGFSAFEHHYEGMAKTRIHKLYVLPDRHGKGYGKFLLEYIEGEAVVHGDTGLHLNVNRFNKALQFYLHNGFEITGEEDIDIGRGYLMEDYIMERAVKRRK